MVIKEEYTYTFTTNEIVKALVSTYNLPKDRIYHTYNPDITIKAIIRGKINEV